MRGWFLGAISAAVLLTGCRASNSHLENRSANSRVSTLAQSAPTPSATYSWCPVLVPGTQVEAQRLPDGAALVFHNTTGDVGAVRARVNEMAFIHDQIAGGSHPRSAGYSTWSYRNGRLSQPLPKSRVPNVGNGEMSRDAIWRAVVQSRAQFEDIEDGAKLVLSAKLPWDIPVIQQFADWRSERMATDHCAILGTPWPRTPSSHG